MPARAAALGAGAGAGPRPEPAARRRHGRQRRHLREPVQVRQSRLMPKPANNSFDCVRATIHMTFTIQSRKNLLVLIVYRDGVSCFWEILGAELAAVGKL